MGFKQLFEWRMWVIWLGIAVATTYIIPFVRSYFLPLFASWPLVQPVAASIVAALAVVVATYMITEYLVMVK